MRRLLLAAATAVIIVSRSGAAESPPPGCSDELDWVARHAAANYAGFADKTAGVLRPAYDSLLAALHGAAAGARGPAECDPVLARWIAFFGDGHLSISRRGAPGGGAPPSDDAIRARFAGWARRPVDEAAVRARLAAPDARPEPIEGVWESIDGRYRVAVLRDLQPDSDFTMTILRADSAWWTPGQVKATFARDTGGTFRTRFFMRDHSEQQWTARVARNVLQLTGSTPWVRCWPTAPGDVTADALRASGNARLTVRELAPGTVLVQLPTFANPRAVDSLFAVEGPRIRAAESLIVDVRGNSGGSDYGFRELLPLIYTGPVRRDGMMVLATDANIAAYDEALAADTALTGPQRAQVRRTVDRMRKHRGGWLVYDDQIDREPAVLERPAHVAVLVDRGCASSCEQFLLAARQSRKTTLYGDRSAGVLDYSNVRSAAMPGGTLVLRHPTTRSSRVDRGAGVDGVGVPPHVRLPADEVDPIAWVQRHRPAPR